jgi:hypothetical protein
MRLGTRRFQRASVMIGSLISKRPIVEARTLETTRAQAPFHHAGFRRKSLGKGGSANAAPARRK